MLLRHAEVSGVSAGAGAGEFRAARARWGFEILGAAALPAIPDLLRVENQGNPASSPAATQALAYLGKDALPPLVALITNTNNTFSYINTKVGSVGS